MELNVKTQIVDAAKNYAENNALSQEAVAEKAGMNISYVNAMFRGNFYLKLSNGKSVKIKDSYFRKLAKAAGHNFETVFWETVETPQYLQIYAELADAKRSGRAKMLIGETGCGKTYTIDRFINDNPVHVYRITVSDLYSVNDIVDELCELLNVTAAGRPVAKLKKIARKFNNIKLDGGKPVLIVDEAENLNKKALRAFKGLYDAVRDFCPIVLVGTGDLSDRLDKLNDKKEPGIPQFVRRFKAGRRNIISVDKRMFAPFFVRVEDEDVRTLIETLSCNYGDLNSYIEPALREAAETKEELTEERFRFQFGLI